MEKFLPLVEQKQEIEIDENKLKHDIKDLHLGFLWYITISIFFVVCGKKTEMLKKYYTDNLLVFYWGWSDFLFCQPIFF